MKLKKLRIARLTNVEKLSIKGGLSRGRDCLTSQKPPCRAETAKECPDSEGTGLI